MEDVTIVNILLAAQGYATEQREGPYDEGTREFALAVTAIEDAIMRVNRGFAKRAGTFTVADVQAGHGG